MSEPFGPFRAECDPVERIAQLRVLRTLVHGHLWTIEEGWHLEAALLCAERDAQQWPDGALGVEETRQTALHLFDMLPTLVKRRILTTFAYIHQPLYADPRKQPKKGTANASVE